MRSAPPLDVLVRWQLRPDLTRVQALAIRVLVLSHRLSPNKLKKLGLTSQTIGRARIHRRKLDARRLRETISGIHLPRDNATEAIRPGVYQPHSIRRSAQKMPAVPLEPDTHETTLVYFTVLCPTTFSAGAELPVLRQHAVSRNFNVPTAWAQSARSWFVAGPYQTVPRRSEVPTPSQ